MKEKLVKVRLGEKDYLIPHVLPQGSLVRITSHPLSGKKLLVWRQLKGLEIGGMQSREFIVRDAAKAGKGITEGKELAKLGYITYGATEGGNAVVYDFIVRPRLRRKAIGSTLRETMMQDLKNRGINEVVFPPHREKGFYLKRGFAVKGFRNERLRGVRLGYVGSVAGLGVRPKTKLKVLWQRAKPRFAK